MMIAHLADVHLGATLYGIDELWEDFFEALEESIDIALKERVDAIIISGDLMHKPRPENRTLVRAIDLLRRPIEAGIPLIVAAGDHDVPRARDVTPLHTLSRALGAGFIYPLPSSGGDLRSVVSSTIIEVKGWLFAVAPFIRDTLERRREKLARIVQAQDSILRHRVSDRKAVFVGHFTLEGLSPWDPIMPASSLPSNVRYAAMGHLHQRIIGTEESSGSVPYAYPGSLYPLNEAEARAEHARGPLLVDLTGDEPVIHEPRVEVRRHVILDITAREISEAERIVKTRLRGLVQSGGRRPLVHLNLKLPPRLYSATATRGLIARLERTLNVIMRLKLGRIEEASEPGRISEYSRLSEEEILAKMLGGNRDLARLVASLRDSLASEDYVGAQRVLEEMLSEKYRSVWSMILRSRR